MKSFLDGMMGTISNGNHASSLSFRARSTRVALQLERKRERCREKHGDIRYSTQGHVFFLLNIPKE